MQQRGLRAALDNQIKGGLKKWLEELRAENSTETIAWLLQEEFKVAVSSRTIARWCDDYGIPVPTKAKAS